MLNITTLFILLTVIAGVLSLCCNYQVVLSVNSKEKLIYNVGFILCLLISIVSFVVSMFLIASN